MSRHHGRRRGLFYGCAYNSKRGPTVCRNNLHMPQEVLEEAVIDSIAGSFDETEVAAAIDRALELLEERRVTAREGRSSHEEALRIVRAEEARLIDAVKQAQELDAARRRTPQGPRATTDVGKSACDAFFDGERPASGPRTTALGLDKARG